MPDTPNVPDEPGADRKQRRRGPFGLSPDTGLARLLKALRAKPDVGQLGVGALIAVLGFAAVEQVQLEEEDLLEGARRSDLIEIFSSLQDQSDRLEAQARDLRDTRRDLLSDEESEQTAREQAQQRQREFGLLAGMLPASGPGIIIRIPDATASDLITAVQELRVAGAEAIQIRGGNDEMVRVGVDTYFLDAHSGANAVDVGGAEFIFPIEVRAIGDPDALEEIQLFLNDEAAESWMITQHDAVGIDAVREPNANEYARPAPADDE
jgi:uncharacterized protein YlxW (UPF0749 family)